MLVLKEQISFIYLILHFYYNRFLTSDVMIATAMGRFRIQLLRNGNWETNYTIGKNEKIVIIVQILQIGL